jgi:hypothetical protein
MYVFVGYYQSCVENLYFHRGNLQIDSLVARSEIPRVNVLAAAFYHAWSDIGDAVRFGSMRGRWSSHSTSEGIL